MAVDKKFFVDINLQGNALKDAVIGSNSKMGTAGSFRFDGTRLEYFNGSSVQSVANLADISAVTGGLILQGGYDAATNTPDIADGNASKGFFWVVTEAGSFLGTSVQVGDSIIAKVDEAGASIGDWLILQGNIVTATDEVEGIVRLATQEEVDAGTEGGAVVLTPATFESSSQLSDIRSDISALENDKLSRDGSQAMEGSLDMGGNSIANINDIAAGSLSGIANQNITLLNNIDAGHSSAIVNLPAPNADGDAANKQYVDDQAAAAQTAAEATASADATAKADAAQAAAESYADGLAVNYDAAGSAATAETNAKAYADSLAPNYDAAGSAATAETNAKAYADSLAPNYDAAGSAAQALTDANAYTDSAISQEVTDRNSAIATAKGEAIADSESYTDGAIAQEVIDRDAAIATAKSEAIADANAYTDTEIAAQSFSSSFVDTAWTESGGVYTLSVAHSVNTSTPKVASYVSGNLVEFAVVVIDANTIELKCNIAAPASVSVGVSK
jgi:hypothetical protein